MAALEADAKRAWALARKEARDAVCSFAWRDALNAAVQAGFAMELEKAFAWVADALKSTSPSGLACPPKEPSDVRKLLQSRDSVTVGGSLAMLCLGKAAYSYHQLNRILYAFEHGWTGKPSDITNIVGTVVVNADMWDGEGFHDLLRASHDSEPGP